MKFQRGHAGVVNCVTLNEDSSVALSGSIDGTVKCWDMKSKSQEPIQVLEEMKDSVTCILVTDHEILVGSADGKVRSYDLRVGKLVTDLITYDGGAVSSISMTSDGQCYLVNTTKPDDTLKLMDKTNGTLLQEFIGSKNSKGYRIECCVGHESRKVISGSENGCIIIWDLVKSTKLETLVVSQDVIHSLTYHPNKEELYCASRNKVYSWTN